MKPWLILLVFVLVACSKGDGGGVVARPESAPPPAGSDGPFGGPISGDLPIPPATPYLPPYTSFDLETLILAASPGSTILLDRDVELNYSVVLNKSLTIRSDPALGRRVKIKAVNLGTLFSATADNLTFRELKIEMVNSNKFLTSILDFNGVPTQNNLTLERLEIYLRGTSSFEVAMNATNLLNSTILGLASGRLVSNDPNQQIPGIPLSLWRGNNLVLQGNNILDVKNNYATSLVLWQNQNVLLRQNVIRCYCEKLTGAITGTDLDNVSLEGNFIHDAHSGRQNKSFPDPDVDGSIAIAFQYSNNVRDNSVLNRYNAEKFVVNDEYLGNSTNINLTGGFIINAFGSNQLFNNAPSEDFTPICALGNNPGLSSSTFSTWLSYLTSAGTLYYSGALRPGCL